MPRTHGALFAVLALLTLMRAAPASAQEPLPSAGALSVERAGELGTHPDDGLMIAGATVFLTGVTIGVAVLMPVELGHCYEPGAERSAGLPPDHGFPSCDQAPRAAIPFAHLLGGGFPSLVAGPILLVAEIVGLFMFIGGAAHHHPNAPATPRSGEVTFAGVRGADVGLALTLHL